MANLSKLLLLTASISLPFVTYGMQQFSTSATRALQRSANVLRVPQQNIPQFSRWQRLINQWNQLRNWYSAKIHKPKLQPLPISSNITKAQISQKPSLTPKTSPTTQQKPSVAITPRAEKYLDNLISTAKPTRGPTHPFFESTPFGPTNRSGQTQPYRVSTRAYSQKARDLGYTLDMPSFNATELAKKLIEHNLTVADVVYAQCAQEEALAYLEIKELKLLSDTDLNILDNVIMPAIKQHVMRTEYDENNIIFDPAVDAATKNMIKDIFQEANVPFKVNVRKGDHSCGSMAGVEISPASRTANAPLISHLCMYHSGLSLAKLDLLKQGLTFEFDLELAPSFFNSNNSDNEKKAMLAHEATHLTNYHLIKLLALEKYLDNKKLSSSAAQSISYSAIKICEIQADLLPLAFHDYALGNVINFKKRMNQPPAYSDLSYLPAYQLFKFASHAIELHAAMQQLTQQRIRDQKFESPQKFLKWVKSRFNKQL